MHNSAKCKPVSKYCTTEDMIIFIYDLTPAWYLTSTKLVLQILQSILPPIFKLFMYCTDRKTNRQKFCIICLNFHEEISQCTNTFCYKIKVLYCCLYYHKKIYYINTCKVLLILLLLPLCCHFSTVQEHER